MQVVPVFDHLLPHCYSGNNEAKNFVAACSVCNSIKSGKVFDSLKEAGDYIRSKRIKRGHPVFGMMWRVHNEKVNEIKLPEKPQDAHVREWRSYTQSKDWRERMAGLGHWVG